MLTAHLLKTKEALAELQASDLDTATARRIKAQLRWARNAETSHTARWRLTRFINFAKSAE